jgi:Ca2+-binding EF-hand superfamily protein
MRYFGASNKEIDLNDLLKLFKEKDSQKRGKLSYADFSKWLGVVIH